MNERKAALQILLSIYEKGAYANIALNEYFHTRQLEDRQRRFITQLVYGTVKAGDTLLWVLQQYIRTSVKKVHPVIRVILQMGIYQLLYMDKVPVSAACNEAVELAKKYRYTSMAKFVNAVLRSVLRDESKRDFSKVGRDTNAYLSLSYWHPRWLVDLFVQEFDKEQARELCTFDNTDAPLILRCNTLRNSLEELLSHLAKRNVETRVSTFCSEGIVCTKHPAIAKMDFLDEGLAQIQDESSMLAAHVLAAGKGDFVIDVCSAPGGKATHIAQLMNNTGMILANDIHEHKLKLIMDNAKRLGITNIKTTVKDARKLGALYKGKANAVLADVPCSGFGVLRRKVDARWHKSRQEIEKLPQLQYEILESAASAVKVGGVLVYSTCTIIRSENSDVVKRFLAEHDEFTLDPIDNYLPECLQGRGDMLQLLPHIDHTDGFFIARMKRIK